MSFSGMFVNFKVVHCEIPALILSRKILLPAIKSYVKFSVHVQVYDNINLSHQYASLLKANVFLTEDFDIS